MKKYMLVFLKKIYRKLNIIYSSSGSMEKYYKMSELCDKEMDINRYKRKRKKIIKYALRVSGRPFQREKINENKEIWKKIQNNELKGFENEIRYINKKGKLVVFPYDYCEKYESENVEVSTSEDNQELCYVIHNGKKLFFPREAPDIVAAKYKDLLMEQDIHSPHRYFENSVPECDVFVDVGSAEGIISLDTLDSAKEIYLLECSEIWKKAIKRTFGKYRDKTHIISRYAGESDDKNTITLDRLLRKYKNKKIVIKMDIEGMELDALKGCKNVMKNNECIFACAIYHTNSEYDEIASFFEDLNYSYETSKGYMLFIHGDMTLMNGKYQRMKPPYFRKGIIRAYKNYL